MAGGAGKADGSWVPGLSIAPSRDGGQRARADNQEWQQWGNDDVLLSQSGPGLPGKHVDESGLYCMRRGGVEG